jgi:hypothetical protein
MTLLLHGQPRLYFETLGKRPRSPNSPQGMCESLQKVLGSDHPLVIATFKALGAWETVGQAELAQRVSTPVTGGKRRLFPRIFRR